MRFAWRSFKKRLPHGDRGIPAMSARPGRMRHARGPKAARLQNRADNLKNYDNCLRHLSRQGGMLT